MKIRLLLGSILILACSFAIAHFTSHKVQINALGDSLTAGIGTTGTGASGSGIYGNFSYPKQLFGMCPYYQGSILNVFGYPGQTASWALTNALPSLKSTIDTVSYDFAIVPIFFGANDLLSETPTQCYSDIVALHNAIRSPKVKTITVTVLNREDTYSSTAFNGKRNAVNALLRANWSTFSDGLADDSSMPIADSSACYNALLFKQNDADGLSGVHLTNLGAYYKALSVKVIIDTMLLTLITSK